MSKSIIGRLWLLQKNLIVPIFVDKLSGVVFFFNLFLVIMCFFIVLSAMIIIDLKSPYEEIKHINQKYTYSKYLQLT